MSRESLLRVHLGIASYTHPQGRASLSTWSLSTWSLSERSDPNEEGTGNLGMHGIIEG